MAKSQEFQFILLNVNILSIIRKFYRGNKREAKNSANMNQNLVPLGRNKPFIRRAVSDLVSRLLETRKKYVHTNYPCFAIFADDKNQHPN